MHPYILYSQEIARDRERRMKQLAILDEERRALRRTNALPEPRLPSVRHTMALGLAMTSRAAASVTRRLDECVADDLGRSLAPTE
jgi:hypothetical protein